MQQEFKFSAIIHFHSSISMWKANKGLQMSLEDEKLYLKVKSLTTFLYDPCPSTLNYQLKSSNSTPILIPWEATSEMWEKGFFSAAIYCTPPNAETGYT